jgi:hypothetical protein
MAFLAANRSRPLSIFEWESLIEYISEPGDLPFYMRALDFTIFMPV